MTNYLLAGGGTAGHVNPLLALAQYIKEQEPASNVYVLGTKEGLEARLVPERGFELLTIARLPFPRKPSGYALKFPGLFMKTVKAVTSMLSSKKIDVVVGFGGYASAPAYRAAKRAKVPYIIHEANARPGLANLLGARKAARVAVTFPGTKIRNARQTGMPLRPEISKLDRSATKNEALSYFNLDPKRRTILITGGSLGARTLNEAFFASANFLSENGVQVLHIWGGLTELRDPDVDHYRVMKYCDRMDLAFAAADFIVSRAGSAAVSEISALGIPAVFVPYAVGNGEQRLNAGAVTAAGGALLVEDQKLTEDFIRGDLLRLLGDEKKLLEMSEISASVGRLNGTENLFNLVQEVLKN